MSPIKVNGVLSNNTSTIAKTFNEHFVSIASFLNDSLSNSNTDPMSYLVGDFVSSMVVPPLVNDDIIKVIKSLKNKQSSTNTIPTSLFKANADLIAGPLAKLFNNSIQTGTFLSV